MTQELIAICVCAMIACLAGYFASPNRATYFQMKVMMDTMKAQLEELQRENKDLHLQLNEMKILVGVLIPAEGNADSIKRLVELARSRIRTEKTAKEWIKEDDLAKALQTLSLTVKEEDTDEVIALTGRLKRLTKAMTGRTRPSSEMEIELNAIREAVIALAMPYP